ncbi:MAG: hypothetical protein C4582_05485 [Desulfobacteraceae bacterium]|nr:MAG: hypothetical protein C4582_05485 [Desulfobacteraceae bacterium]
MIMKRRLKYWLGSRGIIPVAAFTFFLCCSAKDDLSFAQENYQLIESSWFLNMKDFSRSAHGTLSCESCHGIMDESPGGHPLPGTSWSQRKGSTERYDYGRCRLCHKESYERYTKGVHAEALKKEKAAPQYLNLPGDKRAPTCGHCHSSHYEEARLSRVESGRRMTDVCGGCHLSQKKTYMDGFHGKTAVNLGDSLSAYCSDCHGAHNCVSLKTPEAALGACLRCHPKADLSFAKFVIHPAPPAEKDGKDGKKAQWITVIRVVTAAMSGLVLLVVLFSYGHSFLWILRELHEKLRRH